MLNKYGNFPYPVVGVRCSACLNRWSSLRYDHRLLSLNPAGCTVFLPPQPAKAINEIKHNNRDQRNNHRQGECFVVSTCLDRVVDCN